MAFWDELKEKITLGSQEAIQRTREIAEVVTTNVNISESKKKINELYVELGELLVNKAFEGMSASDIAAILEDESADDGSHAIVLDNWREFYTKARFIRSEEEVIAISEKKINDLKSEGKCPNCGTRITGSGTFCPECGARLKPDVPVQEQAAEPAQAQDQAAEPAKPQEEPAAPEKSTGAAADTGTDTPKDTDSRNEEA